MKGSEDRGEVRRKEYVVRRVIRSAVVVAAWHPAAGAIFWRFTDESQVNCPNHYGLGTDIDRAYRFRPGCTNFSSFAGQILDPNTVLRLVDHDHEYGPFEVDAPDGDFALIASTTGLDANDLLLWFHRAIWVECPAPPTIRYLADFNGYLGYEAVWSDDLSDATRFSESEIESGELDTELARRLGEFIELSEARLPLATLAPAAGKDVNHPLEADTVWTHRRLKLGDFDALRKWERVAFQHAARAGREHELAGGEGDISGHIAAFPELVSAFQAGAAVQRCWNAPDNGTDDMIAREKGSTAVRV